MGEFLKRYKVKLKTIGLLFIGSGEELTKKEWYYDLRNKIGYILNEQELFSYIKDHKLESEFEKYMMKNDKSFDVWAREVRIDGDIEKIAKYKFDFVESKNKNARTRDISLFIKDGYGKPYIPGSSLKGALRNIIQSEFLTDDIKRDSVSGIKRNISQNSLNKRNLENLSKNIGEKTLNKLDRDTKHTNNAVNSIMACIKISDSKPLSVNDLCVCQKIDVDANGKDRYIPMVRECIKPDTECEFILTIDESIYDGISIDFIKNAINNYLENYNKEFLSKFSEEVQYEKDTIYLGGGAGYHTKTLTSNILEKVDDRQKTSITGQILNASISSRELKELSKDEKSGVAPHTVKLTEYDGYLEQFGACEIKFEEI